VDGLLLKITYDFLNELEKRGLTSSAIRVKFLSRDATLKGLTFKSFSDFASYIKEYESIIFDRRYLCSAGPFLVIENLVINNKNLNFSNIYYWYNITDKRILNKKIQFDSVRAGFYEKDIQRYIDLMYKLIDTYTKNVNTAIKTRLDSYVDPCYVDAGYVSPNSDPLNN
jgi:hypothetical protein